MTKQFVSFDRNWADEMDVTGFRVLDETEVAQLHAWIESGRNSFYFGTNEGWEAGEITIDDFKFKPITDEEIAVLGKFMRVDKYGSGNFPYFEEIDEDY